jgi:hypothetical protein
LLSQLIHGLKVDAAAIVGALMPVEIVLVHAAELDHVLAFKPGCVIANQSQADESCGTKDALDTNESTMGRKEKGGLSS